MTKSNNLSGSTEKPTAMEDIYRAYYNEKLGDICKSLLKDIFSNSNPGCQDNWVASYYVIRSDRPEYSDTLTYTIHDVKNLSYNRLVNEILPEIQKRNSGYFIGWITKQYPASYYIDLLNNYGTREIKDIKTVIHKIC